MCVTIGVEQPLDRPSPPQQPWKSAPAARNGRPTNHEIPTLTGQNSERRHSDSYMTRSRPAEASSSAHVISRRCQPVCASRRAFLAVFDPANNALAQSHLTLNSTSTPALDRRLSPVMALQKTKQPTATVPSPRYHCGICGNSFYTHGELSNHTRNHPDSSSPKPVCGMCKWPFEDSYELELHQTQNGHGTLPFSYENCDAEFVSNKGLLDHQKPGNGCVKALATPTAANSSNKPANMPVYCDRCKQTHKSQSEFDRHRSDMSNKCNDVHHKTTPPKKKSAAPQAMGYVDPDKPVEQVNIALGYDDMSVISDTPTKDSEDDFHCHDCKRKFESLARFNNHFLGCTPVPSSSKAKLDATTTREVLQATGSAAKQQRSLVVNYTAPQGPWSLAEASRPMPLLTVTLNTRPPVQQRQQQAPRSTPRPEAPRAPTFASSAATDAAVFVCDRNGCGKVCRSEAGLRQHKVDAHGMGGAPLDMTGRDSWMLGQRERERLRAEGLLRQPSESPRGGGGHNAPSLRPLPRPAHPPPSAAARLRPPAARPPPSTAHLPPVSSRVPPGPRNSMPNFQAGSLPTSLNMGGVPELDQAKSIQSKILRLLIQSDIFIHHDGKMEVCGIIWTRIGVARQPDVAAMFDNLCHLPKILQGEYLPPPRAFKHEYTAQYPFGDFQPSPTRNPSKTGLGVVVISCSKVFLENGRQEIVKIAAVDLVTGRILMNHLVCTDPHAKVKDWRSSVTGLFSWRDMEGARQAGYKIFKGWPAARDALHKFIDKDTIIIGHNLRSDLDALRMIHGRAVDIAKVFEKAAGGPLNTAQLALDSLCKNYPIITLKSDPEYGRDVLMNAFAAREFGLWALKNEAELKKSAKQKSMEYLAANPRAALAAA